MILLSGCALFEGIESIFSGLSLKFWNVCILCMCAILQFMQVLSNNLHVLPGRHPLSRQFPLLSQWHQSTWESPPLSQWTPWDFLVLKHYYNVVQNFVFCEREIKPQLFSAKVCLVGVCLNSTSEHSTPRITPSNCILKSGFYTSNSLLLSWRKFQPQRKPEVANILVCAYWREDWG